MPIGNPIYKRAPPKGPYNVIMYLDDDEVILEDPDGKTLGSGEHPYEDRPLAQIQLDNISAAGGGKLYCAPGNYWSYATDGEPGREDGQNLMIGSNVEFCGSRGTKWLRMPQDPLPSTKMIVNWGSYQPHDPHCGLGYDRDILVHDIEVDGNLAGIQFDGPPLGQTYMEYYGIWFGCVVRAEARNCWVHDCPREGISGATYTREVTLRNNWINNCMLGTSPVPPNDWLIVGNHYWDNQCHIQAEEAPGYDDGVAAMQIIGNTFHCGGINNAVNGLALTADDNYPCRMRTLIANNQFRHAGTSSALVATNALIVGNSFFGRGCGGWGHRNVWYGNFIDGWDQTQYGGITGNARSRIYYNTIINSQRGIGASYRCVYEHNYFDSTVVDTTGGMPGGFVPEYNIIRFNTFTDLDNVGCPYFDKTATDIIKYNRADPRYPDQGYFTERSGIGTIAVGEDHAHITHNLWWGPKIGGNRRNLTPTDITITPTNDWGDRRRWFESIGDVEFVLKVNGVVSGTPLTFSWQAEV